MAKATQRRKGSFWAYSCEGQESITITEQKPGTKHQAWWQRQLLKTHIENGKQEAESEALETSKPTSVTYFLQQVQLLSLDKHGDQLVTKHSKA